MPVLGFSGRRTFVRPEQAAAVAAEEAGFARGGEIARRQALQRQTGAAVSRERRAGQQQQFEQRTLPMRLQAMLEATRLQYVAGPVGVEREKVRGQEIKTYGDLQKAVIEAVSAKDIKRLDVYGLIASKDREGYWASDKADVAGQWDLDKEQLIQDTARQKARLEFELGITQEESKFQTQRSKQDFIREMSARGYLPPGFRTRGLEEAKEQRVRAETREPERFLGPRGKRGAAGVEGADLAVLNFTRLTGGYLKVLEQRAVAEPGSDEARQLDRIVQLYEGEFARRGRPLPTGDRAPGAAAAPQLRGGIGGLAERITGGFGEAIEAAGLDPREGFRVPSATGDILAMRDIPGATTAGGLINQPTGFLAPPSLGFEKPAQEQITTIRGIIADIHEEGITPVSGEPITPESLARDPMYQSLVNQLQQLEIQAQRRGATTGALMQQITGGAAGIRAPQPRGG